MLTDRYGNFQSNLNPFSNNIDSFGTVSTGLNGLGTPLLKLNHYSDYLSCQNRRNAMDDLYLKDSRDWYDKRNESPFEKNTFKISVWEPIKFNLSQKINDFDLPIIEPFKPLSIFKNTNLLIDNFLDKKRYW